MKELIQQKLAALEAEHGFRILYANESGSRAWGFASADSDYDVRFIYAWPEERYLSILEPRETIDLAIDENLLDISGWDFRKALRLSRKSNGSLTEWLFSPIVYQENEAVMNEWRELATAHFVARSSAAHYLGLCRKMWGGISEGDDETAVTAKRYLYTLRSLLAGQFVIENRQPVAVLFSELRGALDLPAAVESEIDAMISKKSGGQEKDGIPRNATLDEFIATELERLSPLLSKIEDEPGPLEEFDAFFRRVVAG